MTSSARFPVGRSHILLLQLPDHITFCLFHSFFPLFSAAYPWYTLSIFYNQESPCSLYTITIYSLSEAVLKTILLFLGVIPEEEQASLAALAEEHRTVPFVLPGFRNTSFYPAMLQKTKNMMQNYYQIDAFTRHTVSLLEENGIPGILLKGISLAACYPVPEYRKLGDLDLYINEPKALEKAKALLEAQGYKEEKRTQRPSSSPTVIRFRRPAAASCWSSITGWWACISMSRPTRPWMKSIPP